MASERIQILISESGGRIVRKELESIGAAAGSAGGAVYSLRSALLSLVSGAALSQLAKMADEVTRLHNRFAILTSSSGEVAAVFERLQDIADETRSSLSATGDLYARIALATKNMGLAQQEALDITKRLNQAVVLSGANVREAEAAILQFSQGLASGRLAGDELRAVLEQLPIVADIIGKKLNATRGALRYLAKEGMITPEVIIEAFQDIGPELEAAFANTIPTIAQSIAVLHNSVLRVLNTMNESTSIFAEVARGIIKLSGHIETFARVVIAGILTGAITAAAIALTYFSTILLANPFTAIAAGILATVNLLIVFSDQIKITADGSVDLRDELIATFDVLSVRFREMAREFRETWNEFWTPILDFYDLLNVNGETAFGGFVRIADIALGKVNALVYGLSDSFDLMPEAIQESLQKGLNVILRFADNVARHVRAFMDTIVDYLSKHVSAAIDKIVVSVLDMIEGLLDIPGAKKWLFKAIMPEGSDFQKFKDDLFGTLKSVREAYQVAPEDLSFGNLFDKNLLQEKAGSYVAEIEVTAEGAGKKFRDAFMKGWREGGAFSGFADLVKEIDDLAKKQAAVRRAREEQFARDKQLAALGLSDERAPDGKLRSLSDIVLEDKTRKLNDEVRALGLSAREHRVINELLQEENRLRSAGVQETAIKNMASDLESLIREKTAMKELTASLLQLNAELPKTSDGFEQMLSIREKYNTMVREAVQWQKEGTISTEQYNQVLDYTQNRIKNLTEVYRLIKGPQEQFQDRLDAINEIRGTPGLTQDQSNGLELAQTENMALKLRASREGLQGLQAGVLQLQEEFTNMARLVEDSLVSAFHGAEDALTQFIVKGKADFRALAESIASDLVKIGLRQFITGPLLNLAGQYFGGGNLGAGFGGGRAGGGSVLPGQWYTVGEEGPELLRMGSSGGQVYSSKDSRRMQPTGGGTTVNQVTNVNMRVSAKDAGSFKESERQIVSGIRRRARF